MLMNKLKELEAVVEAHDRDITLAREYLDSITRETNEFRAELQNKITELNQKATEIESTKIDLDRRMAKLKKDEKKLQADQETLKWDAVVLGRRRNKLDKLEALANESRL